MAWFLDDCTTITIRRQGLAISHLTVKDCWALNDPSTPSIHPYPSTTCCLGKGLQKHRQLIKSICLKKYPLKIRATGSFPISYMGKSFWLPYFPCEFKTSLYNQRFSLKCKRRIFEGFFFEIRITSETPCYIADANRNVTCYFQKPTCSNSINTVHSLYFAIRGDLSLGNHSEEWRD